MKIKDEWVARVASKLRYINGTPTKDYTEDAKQIISAVAPLIAAEAIEACVQRLKRPGYGGDQVADIRREVPKMLGIGE